MIFIMIQTLVAHLIFNAFLSVCQPLMAKLFYLIDLLWLLKIEINLILKSLTHCLFLPDDLKILRECLKLHIGIILRFWISRSTHKKSPLIANIVWEIFFFILRANAFKLWCSVQKRDFYNRISIQLIV